MFHNIEMTFLSMVVSGLYKSLVNSNFNVRNWSKLFLGWMGVQLAFALVFVVVVVRPHSALYIVSSWTLTFALKVIEDEFSNSRVTTTVSPAKSVNSFVYWHKVHIKIMIYVTK